MACANVGTGRTGEEICLSGCFDVTIFFYCLVKTKRTEEYNFNSLQLRCVGFGREKLRREMKSLYEETYWCPPRFLGVLRDNTLKNLF